MNKIHLKRIEKLESVNCVENFHITICTPEDEILAIFDQDKNPMFTWVKDATQDELDKYDLGLKAHNKVV